MPYYLANKDPRQLRRDIRGVILCVATFLITMSIVSVVVVVFAVFFEHPEILRSYSLDSGALSYDEIAEDFTDVILETFDKYAGLGSILGMLCGLPWFFLIRGKNFLTKDVTKVHSKINVGTLAVLFVMILGVQFFMTLVQAGIEVFFYQDGNSLTDALDESTVSLSTSFWGVLYIAIIGPICEELVFRGAVMRKLERYGANFAIIMSALIFGLYHMILFQAVFAIFIGIILAYTAGRFSLKWSILLHMLNNSLVVVSTLLGSEMFNMAVNITFALSLVATIIILITQRSLLAAQKQAGAPSEPQVYSRAFSSPFLIIYIILTVGTGISLLGVF